MILAKKEKFRLILKWLLQFSNDSIVKKIKSVFISSIRVIRVQIK